jgi:TPR repeat protein
MRARSRAVAAAWGIFVVTAMTPLHSAAYAQSADLVLCDRIAADPTDPDKPATIPGVPRIAQQDIPIAIKFCKAAAGASRRALYELGRAYAANGQMSEAVAAYRKAVAKGSSAAMVELAVLLQAGAGVAKDDAQARALFQRAAAAGNPRALTRLATSGAAGGGAADPAQEREMLTRAAEGNSADAQFQLGLMYANGVGGPKDDVAARSWFEKAAAQNNPNALEWMGSFAASGRGGPRDINAAKDYYARAAALGDEDAKVQLKRLECSVSIKDSRGHYVGCL